MTHSKTLLACGVGVLLVVGGIVLKLVRYLEVGSPNGEAMVTQLTGFVETHGWQADLSAPIERSGSLTVLTYQKSGCDRPLKLALLGSTDGLDSYLRQRFGDGLYYIQNNERRARPSMLRFHLNAAAAIVRQALGGAASIRQQIFAVVPPQSGSGTPCRAPNMSAWQQNLNR
jgi:hypothetical protein